MKIRNALALSLLGLCACTHTPLAPIQGSLRTTVFILVDGLPVRVLKGELEGGRLPVLARTFGPRLEHEARSVFPSLTIPNLASLLSGKTVEEHGFLANQLLRGEELIDFTSPFSTEELNDRFLRSSLFARLSQRGQHSLSLDPYFQAGASAALHRSLSLGLNYLNHDFAAVDEAILGKLQQFLESHASTEWPEFIFVHVLGVDGLAHQWGPAHPKVAAHLRKLDAWLAPSLSRLLLAESRGHRLQILLGADHGMMTVKSFADLDQALKSIFPVAPKVTNRGRSAMVYLPQAQALRKAAYLPSLEKLAGVHLVLSKIEDTVFIEGRAGRARFRYLVAPHCAEGFGLEWQEEKFPPQALCPREAGRLSFYGPGFLENLAHYFRAPAAPDFLLLAAPGVSFGDGLLGEHGGLTPEEMITPLLLHGLEVHDSEPIPLEHILDFLTAR